jgi:hypothetical protein
MQEFQARATFILSRSIKDELEEAVSPGRRSQFVERAIADALLKEAKRRAIASLQTMEVYDTGGSDSVEVLRRIRRERANYVASRHEALGLTQR